ncbi:Adenosylhomocysteinase [Nocardioides sp. AX2bis]|nr:Adenosylhomocysteinase [Nocardioides sp. AX2bis]
MGTRAGSDAGAADDRRAAPGRAPLLRAARLGRHPHRHEAPPRLTRTGTPGTPGAPEPSCRRAATVISVRRNRHLGCPRGSSRRNA